MQPSTLTVSGEERVEEVRRLRDAGTLEEGADGSISETAPQKGEPSVTVILVWP